MDAWTEAQLEKEDRERAEILKKHPNPKCIHHPDREGHAFYRHIDNPKKLGEALCLECLEVRLNLKTKQTVEEHAAECKLLDELAVMFGDGVKRVYPGELEKAKSLRRKNG